MTPMSEVGFDASITQLFFDQWTAPFWEAAGQHRLVACRCADCGTFRMPPTALCWRCRSRDTDWPELPGTGSVYTYTVARHPLTPAVTEALPYVIAVVTLDGAPGARLITNLVDVDPDEVHVGMEVSVIFDDVSPTASLPLFGPRR